MNRPLERTVAVLLMIILGLIVLHAPLTVFVGSTWPQLDLVIKGWKELLIVLAAIGVSVLLIRHKRWDIIRGDWLFWLIGAYAALHIVLLPFFDQSPLAKLLGLALDLRYLAVFVVTCLFIRMYPNYRRRFVKLAAIGAIIVVGFATLQLFLPRDFLTIIGYGHDTIRPYLLVDNNPNFVRISSTLRGPNPLGAYLGIVLASIVAWAASRPWQQITQRQRWVLAVGVLTSLSALYMSHSRSAWIGAFVAVVLVVAIRYGRKLPRYIWGVGLGMVALALVGVLVFRDVPLVSKIVFHEDPLEGNNINSNDQHVESLAHGFDRMIAQPFGAGVGSTGSASLQGDQPIIIENHYLYVAHETGWLGFVLFGVIMGVVLHRLWLRRRDWLALAVFASGIGMCLIGLLLPVWADDTIGIVWWMLAAISLASPIAHRTVEYNKVHGKTNKKTA